MTRQSRRDAISTRAVRDRDFQRIWGRLEPMTQQLIDDLVARGWDRKQIEVLAASGWKYNRERDSLMLQGGEKW